MLEARVGFAPTNGGFADSSKCSILLARLAFIFLLVAGFGRYLGRFVPKLFPNLFEDGTGLNGGSQGIEFQE
jgi:hypothetical protein